MREYTGPNTLLSAFKLIRQGINSASAYAYAVAGGYKGTKAEFQAIMGSGPWIPGTSADLNKKQNAQVARLYSLAPNTGWNKFGQISNTASFTLYAFVSNIVFGNPAPINVALLAISGRLDIYRASGSLLYLIANTQLTSSDYVRIVLTKSGGLYAKKGTYSSGEYDGLRKTGPVTIFETPIAVDTEPEDILWDSVNNIHTVQYAAVNP